MSVVTVHILSIVTLLPLLGALALTLVPRRLDRMLRGGAIVVSLATFALSVRLYAAFDGGSASYQFEEQLAGRRPPGPPYPSGTDASALLLCPSPPSSPPFRLPPACPPSRAPPRESSTPSP